MQNGWTKLNRSIYLPPMLLVVIHMTGQGVNGEQAEQTTAAMMDEFIETK